MKNLGVTTEVFGMLTPRQKRIFYRATNPLTNRGAEVVLLFPNSNVLTHARTMGWQKYTTINMKTGHKILIKRE